VNGQSTGLAEARGIGVAKGAEGRLLRGFVVFVRGIVVACSLTFFVGAASIILRRSRCPVVVLDMRPPTFLYACVAERGTSAFELPGGPAAALMFALGCVLFFRATLSYWQGVWYRRRRAPVMLTMPVREPVPTQRSVVPGASKVCPWCAEPVDVTDIVCRTCNGALPQLRGAVPPPADEWGALRAAHPHAFGPVLHSAEQIPMDQWPADGHAALDRACSLFTTAGLNANQAVRRAFLEAAQGSVSVVDEPSNGPADRGDEPPTPTLAPRLPPR
jgi:hypothetical protein